MAELMLMAAAALVIAALLVGVLRRYALSKGVMDVPNERSSHVVPTPRGGGLAIVIATTITLALLTALGFLSKDAFVALAGGGLSVAFIGFVDDRYKVSVRLRITVHLAAAAWALAWLGGLPPLQIGHQIISLGWVGDVLAVLGMVWVLNLFNFMDGIDGIAAVEAAFIAVGGAVVAHLRDVADEVTAAASVFAAACGGFLLWNWPPAKIFMGDVGSGYLGYVIAVLAVIAAREHPAALFVWLILGGLFFVDATVTLVRRLARRARVYEAHRSHAYQRLARRWSSHQRVTVLTIAVNLAWLFPCALLASMRPDLAGWIAIAALAPIALLVIVLGAGKGESGHT